MSTATEVREQVSRYLGDWKPGTTTGAGTAVSLVDSNLRIETEDSFLSSDSNRTLIHLPTGRDGLSSAETVLATGFRPRTGTVAITPTGAAIATSVSYEIHRLFSPTDKDDAVTEAISKCWPVVFKRVVDDYTWVVDQQDYDISASGLFNNSPRQVHWVDRNDTERTRVLFDWQANFTDDAQPKLHFYSNINTTDSFRVFGHAKKVLADFVEDEDGLILAVRAALWLLRSETARARIEDRRWVRELIGDLEAEEARVVSAYRSKGFDVTVPRKVHGNRQPNNVFDG